MGVSPCNKRNIQDQVPLGKMVNSEHKELLHQLRSSSSMHVDMLKV